MNRVNWHLWQRVQGADRGLRLQLDCLTIPHVIHDGISDNAASLPKIDGGELLFLVWLGRPGEVSVIHAPLQYIWAVKEMA